MLEADKVVNAPELGVVVPIEILLISPPFAVSASDVNVVNVPAFDVVAPITGGVEK